MSYRSGVDGLNITRKTRESGNQEPENLGKIESGIPLPPRDTGRKRKYPFGDMNVGDSMLMPKGSLHSAWRYARVHPGFRFASRREGEYIRVWRIEPSPPPRPEEGGTV